MSSGENRRLNARENKKVTAIMESAQTLFARNGYNKTTVDEIARQADVAKGTLYKYFRSKNDVFKAVVVRENNQINHYIMEAVNKADSPIKKIRALLDVKIRELRKAVTFYRVTRDVAQELWPRMDAVRTDFLNWERNLLKDILNEGIKAGRFKIDKPEMAANVMAIVFKSLELEWVMEQKPSQLQPEVDTLIELILWGISGKKQG
ncbi:MAG: TetR/AcrR family transcriptional regulator [candidate division Zixibacteria bacterium]|nr:TetR/AcrR family transcriptional regulator [candidate division Zixibacteria bacterium]MDD5426211.1 TetR/AcrR family transcriptional regulator [candidate division Zixibacteria bacterium]